MRSAALVLATVTAGIAAVALWAPAGAQTAAPSELDQARAEQARAQRRAAALDAQARSATVAGERATLAAAALAARVQQAEAAVAGADAQVAELRARRRALDRRLAQERAPVANLMAGLQTQLRRPPVLTLLQPGSIEDAVHLRAVLAAVGPQITARTAALRGEVARSRSLEQAAERLAVQRRARQSELATRRRELAALSAAERLRARRAAGAADREAERAFAIGLQTRTLAGLVRGLDVDGSAATRRQGADVAKGPVPYRLPVDARALPDPASGGRGLTFVPRPGALVVAPAAGRIAFAGPYRGFGQIVIVEHADGWTSLVTGLARTQVAVGQAVVASFPLGEAPRAGPAIGLELRLNGQRVNPIDQLR